MTIDSSNNINADLIAQLNGQTNSSSSASSTATSNLQAIQSQFMTLLTAELKNQDPTKPLDNTEMTTQLAQMSTVEGINKLNDSMGTLLGSYQSAQTSQAASLIGHQVLVDGSSLTLNKSLGGGAVDLPSDVDGLTVHIVDSNGQEVRTLNMGQQGSGVQSFVWDGKDNTGQQLADGNYTYTVDATKSGNKVDATTLALASVNSVVVNSGGGLQLSTSVGARDMSQVRQIF